MRRVYWTIDYLDAHVVAQFLRAAGTEAWVFDDHLVRQDWMHAMAFGGFRVMTSDADSNAAGTALADWNRGACALTGPDAVDDDVQRCARCGNRAEADPWPRRFGFLFLWLFPALLVIGRFHSRYRCPRCGRRWHEPAEPYAHLAACAEHGEGGSR